MLPSGRSPTQKAKVLLPLVRSRSSAARPSLRSARASLSRGRREPLALNGLRLLCGAGGASAALARRRARCRLVDEAQEAQEESRARSKGPWPCDREEAGEYERPFADLEVRLPPANAREEAGECEQPFIDLEADFQTLTELLTGDPFYILLAFVPVALANDVMDMKELGISLAFGLNCIAILPLGKLLGFSTEELALGIGKTLGAFLNVSLASLVELIVAVFALKAGLVSVVKAGIIGGLLSNILLCIGLSFLFGGLKNRAQTFSTENSSNQSSLLLLANLAVVLPSLYLKADGNMLDELEISRITAVVLAIVYVFYVVFSLSEVPAHGIEAGADEPAKLSRGAALLLLALCTVAVAECSESLANSVEPLTEQLGCTQTFVGVVVLPIVGGAAEYFTAVNFAVKNRSELSLDVALGAATQTALLYCPFTVLVGWFLGVPMDLNFQTLSIAVLLLVNLILINITSDGKSTWLEGLMLIAAYTLIAVTYFFSTTT